jgi:predicted SAM-dependent methyltransferase
MKLHLGCGSVHLKGFVNIDANPDTAADLVTDALALPFADFACEEIRAYQLIEHLGYSGAVFALAEWYRLLKPGGRLVIETPDIAGSFRKFLGAQDRKSCATVLGWIFGEESPGLQHKLLFPRDMLDELLGKAGFKVVREEEPRTYTFEPGIRLVCRKAATPWTDALCRLKTQVYRCGLVNVAKQPEVIEFENIFVGNLAKSIRKGAKRRDILENIAISAPMTARWLEAAQRSRLIPQREARRLLALAEKLDKLNFNGILFEEFKRLPRGGEDFRDGYEHVFRKAVKFVETAVGDGANLRRLFRAAGFRGALSAGGRLRSAGFFSKARCIELAFAIRDKGVRHFTLGELDKAEKLLRTSAAFSVEPFYALWNLAVLMVVRNDVRGAAAFYKDALRHAHPACRHIVGRETVVCLMHAGEFEDALAALTEMNNPSDARGLKAVILFRLGLRRWAKAELGDRRSRPARIPPLRTGPVLVGEGVNVCETV